MTSSSDGTRISTRAAMPVPKATCAHGARQHLLAVLVGLLVEPLQILPAEGQGLVDEQRHAGARVLGQLAIELGDDRFRRLLVDETHLLGNAGELVVEDLQQHGVLHAPVDDVDLAHPARERVDRALHLRDHSLANDAAALIVQKPATAVISAEEIFGTAPRAVKADRARSRSAQISFSDLKQGDLVVHITHGIGQYEGLVKLKINGSANDFLLILYKDQDKLYLPVDRASRIQKYVSTEDHAPALDKLGGTAWARLKERVDAEKRQPAQAD